jgi:GNAT superfamily N-acetyltransferase
MAIRDAAEADLPALMPLLRGYCDFYDMHPDDDGLERVARGVIAAPEDEAFLLVATDEAEAAVGIAVCVWTWSSLHGGRIVYLNDLFVSESARGGGHADALIEAVAEVARRNGAGSVNWLTATDNHRAQAVYDRVGAEYETFREYELEL